MADEKKEKRNLLDDIQKNIIDKIGNENIMEGDISRYKIPEKLPEVPIKTIERSKKKVIEDESEFEKAFNYGMQKAYERNKLPTKYTKEGLLQAALTFTNVGMAPMLEKYKQDQDPEVKKKRKYIEGYTDIAKSIMRGGPNFVKGASEFVLGPIDYAFNTDFQTKFNKMMNTKEVLGEAETLPGALSELLV
jgi:riboflavin synthase